MPLFAFGDLFYIISYCFMGEIVAIIGIALQTAQSLFYSVLETKNVKPRWWMLATFLTLTATYSIFTYSAPQDLFIIGGTMIFSVLMYTTNVKLYKYGMLVYNACNITYNTLLKLYMGIVLECTLTTFSIAGLVIYLKWLKKHPNNECSQNADNTKASMDLPAKSKNCS